MLARFHLLLPFRLTVPDKGQFRVWQYDDEGYAVRVFPPVRREGSPIAGVADEVRMDDVPAFEADVLRIDFHKESFDRANASPCDPSEAVIGRAINSFLIRLRYVTRAAQIRLLDYPWGSWRLRYLNDDETELEVDENLVRGRGAVMFSLSWTAVNAQVWDDIHELEPDFEPPAWEDLLIDARADLPRIGPAVVLAATALEVFISRMLNSLAEAGAAPAPLWAWINKRGDYLREPTVEEQYDVLLRFFTGHSLKDEPKLWEAFRNLKTARNSFVHEGAARLGGADVSLEAASNLIASAGDVVSKVREWLPAELQWRVFRHNIRIETIKKLT
jgi:hypothetical protein